MNNEAPAVAFFHYKRSDGFEVALTLRGENGTNVLEKIDKAIEKVKADGGVPAVKGFGKKETAPKEYAAHPCPTCGSKVISFTTSGGKKAEKCETQKYINGVTSGCSYIKWL